VFEPILTCLSLRVPAVVTVFCQNPSIAPAGATVRAFAAVTWPGFVVSGAFTLLMLSAGPQAWAEAPIKPVVSELECGPPPPGGEEGGGRQDFRSMGSSVETERSLRVYEQFHLNKAERNMREGSLQPVMQDLHFVLRRVPNHERALRMLIAYTQNYGVPSAQKKQAGCYFVWARNFAENDVAVLNYGGYYFWRAKDDSRAKEWWNAALALDTGLAEVHYNLGLLYAAEEDYDRARQHAWQAYAAGYPLPGLRDRLKAAGQWREPPVPPADANPK